MRWAAAEWERVARWRGAYLLAALLVLVVATAARLHHLETQSLWNDEGNSLRLAQRSVPDLIDAAGRDIHPPGYYLALKGWIGLAGDGEFSLRMLSVLQGVLTVAVVIALGRALFSRAAGVLAGLLVALSAFAVYYSQETRMYAQLGLLSAASMWVFAIWWRKAIYHRDHRENSDQRSAFSSQPSRRGVCCARYYVGLALALINAAGLYTQYSFPFTMLAQGALLAAWIMWRMSRGDSLPRRMIADYAALNAITLALFVPWLPTAWDQVTTWPRTGVDRALAEQLRTVLTWITAGNTAGTVAWTTLVWPGLLALAALVPSRAFARRAERGPYGWRVGLPLVWGGVVIGALVVSGAYREANLKFLLPAQAAAALLIGQGARRLWALAPPDRRWRLSAVEQRAIGRMVAAVCLFLVVIEQARALDALYGDPAYARDDYRGMAALITADARPGDAVVLDAPNQAEVFTYYYAGETPVYELPRGLGGDDAQTRADVLAVIRDHRRIFVLFWGEDERDPNHVVQATLDEHAYPVESRWFGDVRLALYAVLEPAPDAPQTMTDARFGTQSHAAITLAGYALSAESLRPGDVIGVTLFWSADAPLEVRYKVTVQLLAPDGLLIGQHDAEPGNNRVPTTTWTPGETVIDTHGLVAPPDLPPGTYTIIVGLYDPDAPLDRLPVTVEGQPVGDTLTLATVPVE